MHVRRGPECLLSFHFNTTPETPHLSLPSYTASFSSLPLRSLLTSSSSSSSSSSSYLVITFPVYTPADPRIHHLQESSAIHLLPPPSSPQTPTHFLLTSTLHHHYPPIRHYYTKPPSVCMVRSSFTTPSKASNDTVALCSS